MNKWVVFGSLLIAAVFVVGGARGQDLASFDAVEVVTLKRVALVLGRLSEEEQVRVLERLVDTGDANRLADPFVDTSRANALVDPFEELDPDAAAVTPRPRPARAPRPAPGRGVRAE